MKVLSESFIGVGGVISIMDITTLVGLKQKKELNQKDDEIYIKMLIDVFPQETAFYLPRDVSKDKKLNEALSVWNNPALTCYEKRNMCRKILELPRVKE